MHAHTHTLIRLLREMLRKVVLCVAMFKPIDHRSAIRKSLLWMCVISQTDDTFNVKSGTDNRFVQFFKSRK